MVLEMSEGPPCQYSVGVNERKPELQYSTAVRVPLGELNP